MTAVLLTSKKRWKMINKTQMKTICITVAVIVIVGSVITAVVRMISKDWTNVFNNVALALSWGIILKHELDNYHDEI